MARRAAPYSTYEDPRTGLAWLNTRIDGKRIRKPLGLPFRDDAGGQAHARSVGQAAAQAYADLVQGRVLAPVPAGRVRTSATLGELVADWLVDDAKTYPASPTTTITHAKHFEAFAEQPRDRDDRRTPLERLTADSGPTEYARARLRAVLKKTVTKEITTLFRLLGWAKERGYIASLPARPEYPRKAVGVRSGTQRAKAVPVSHAEMLRIIAALPVWTTKGGRRLSKQPPPGAIYVRDLARFAYETGLRPSTVARLQFGTHYRAGDPDRLWIPPEIDKGKGEARYVSMTKTAADIIARHAARAEPGRCIFGAHDLRVQWKRAAAKVLPPDRAADFAPYDFRHGAARRFVGGGNLLGAMQLLGHRHATTTNKYLAPMEAHGDAVIAALGKKSARRA